MTYLKNAWYAGAFDQEVTRDPLSRILLDILIVFYRTENGDVVALADRCPHRFVPLSRGRVVGDQIECGYHGLRFDRSGACAFNPHSKALPKAVRTRSFPTVERYGMIWFWPGDPEKTDPSLIPSDFGFLDSPDFTVVRGYLHIKGNYQLITDNLLDLSHVPYAHPQFGIQGVSAEERIRTSDYTFEREGNTVWTRRNRFNVPPNDLSRRRFGITCDDVNTRTHMHWIPPSFVHFDLGTTENSEAGTDYALPAAHFITPETEFASHYFYLQGRNAAKDDKEISREILESTTFAFETQDSPLIEMQQCALGMTSDLMAKKPLLLNVDGGPVLARRILAELIAEEG